MFGAVGLTAIASFATMATPIWTLLFTSNGLSAFYYILLFGGLALSIWSQVRAFHLKPSTGGILLALYSVMMGVVMTPLLLVSVTHNPWTILFAFIIASVMFACMALFGYKTVRDLSFLRIFLFMGMIGLILVGIASFIWPALVGGTFGTIVCLIGVLVFALFTAYDMQTLKSAYNYVGDDTQRNQLAVLGALHLYISFIAMFQYILSLLNRD
jgi:FtsH-binding integral membrane protein